MNAPLYPGSEIVAVKVAGAGAPAAVWFKYTTDREIEIGPGVGTLVGKGPGVGEFVGCGEGDDVGALVGSTFGVIAVAPGANGDMPPPLHAVSERIAKSTKCLRIFNLAIYADAALV